MKITKKEILEKSGIYKIINLVNNKVYIGQSKNVYRRAIYHRFELNHNRHQNPHLQYSWNKYGKENFKFEVIEYCNNLTKKEKFYISNFNGELYNIKEATNHPGGNNKPLSNQHKLNISNSMKGKIPSNLREFQLSNVRKVAYFVDNQLIKIFNSCQEGADYFNMDSRTFNYFIGKIRKQKSKYFVKNERIEYYEE